MQNTEQYTYEMLPIKLKFWGSLPLNETQALFLFVHLRDIYLATAICQIGGK